MASLRQRRIAQYQRAIRRADARIAQWQDRKARYQRNLTQLQHDELTGSGVVPPAPDEDTGASTQVEGSGSGSPSA